MLSPSPKIRMRKNISKLGSNTFCFYAYTWREDDLLIPFQPFHSRSSRPVSLNPPGSHASISTGDNLYLSGRRPKKNPPSSSISEVI